MAKIDKVLLKRTALSLNHNKVKNVILDYGEPLVAPDKKVLVIGNGTDKVSASSLFIATNVVIPRLTLNEFIYSGNVIDITSYITPYLSDFYDVSGYSRTAKGNYNVEFTLKSGYKWSDNSTNNIILSWSIVDSLTDPVALADEANKLLTAKSIDGVSFDGSSNITHYGRCSTAASTTAKVATIGDYSLVDGASLWIKFLNANSSNATLDINGTGAKKLLAYDGGSFAKWVAGEILDIIYDSEADNGNGAYLVDGHALATEDVPGIVRITSDNTSAATDVAATPSMVQTKSKVYVQSTAPASGNVGDLWINTSNGTMKYYYNSTWNSVYSVFA